MSEWGAAVPTRATATATSLRGSAPSNYESKTKKHTSAWDAKNDYAKAAYRDASTFIGVGWSSARTHSSFNAAPPFDFCILLLFYSINDDSNLIYEFCMYYIMNDFMIESFD